MILFALWLNGCGNVGSSTSSGTGGGSGAPATPAVLSGHVVIIMLENHSYSSVIGNPVMPYLNGLAAQGTLATAYYANTHPSMGNYFMLTTGQLIGDDAYSGIVTADNVVRELNLAGKSWKTYQEALPYAGYLGGDVYPYVLHHNPFAFFSDVVNDPRQQANLAPLTTLAADLAAQALPNYSFIVPSMQNDAHDCPAALPACTDQDKLAAADSFLSAYVPGILSNSAFRRDGLLLVLFDESILTDLTGGGGHVALVLVGPKVRNNFQSAGYYQHPSTLRLTLDQLGIATLPGAAASAPPILDPFLP